MVYLKSTAAILLLACSFNATANNVNSKAPQKNDVQIPWVKNRKLTMECVYDASRTYSFPVNVLLAVLETEGGKAGLAVPNTNGTFDYGRAQVNTVNVKRMAKYGISLEHLRDDECYATYWMAWFLVQMQNENRTADFWTKVGYYNSHNPKPNAAYVRKVRPKAAKWARILDEMNVNSKTVWTVKGQPGLYSKQAAN